jgi:hypothetical protein
MFSKKFGDMSKYSKGLHRCIDNTQVLKIASSFHEKLLLD